MHKHIVEHIAHTFCRLVCHLSSVVSAPLTIYDTNTSRNVVKTSDRHTGTVVSRTGFDKLVLRSRHDAASDTRTDGNDLPSEKSSLLHNNILENERRNDSRCCLPAYARDIISFPSPINHQSLNQCCLPRDIFAAIFWPW